MGEVTSYEHGTPSWVDIGTPDLERAIAFYGGLFGWEVEIGDPEYGRYSMARLRGRPVAGLADQQAPGQPVYWASYISVDDVDATVERVVKAGGATVLEPMDILTEGRMAVTTDAGGAFISFWQPRDHIGSGIVNEAGTLCWNELTTRAVDESLAFYNDVLGWTSEKVGFDGADYYELKRGGATVAGLMPMVGEMWPPELPNHWMVYFAVDDTDAAAARAAELGGTVSVPPTDIPPGRFAVLNDPDGAVFSIIRLSAPRT